MNKGCYIIATIRPWNIKSFHDVIANYPGEWHLFDDPDTFTMDNIRPIDPEYIFFPHWSEKVPSEILHSYRCINFHETDLPFGRGGSPVQNLISAGYSSTMITALIMTDKVDAGPIILKRELGLDGSAEEIFIRSSKIIAEMIQEIIKNNWAEGIQEGEVTSFKRRKPEQSQLPVSAESLDIIFNHIRMLDADEYPKAFMEFGGFRFEFTRPSLKTYHIHADVQITKIEAE